METKRRYSLLIDWLRWTKDVPVDKLQIIVSAIGMVGPIAFGAAKGHLPTGLLAAMGSLAVSGIGFTSNLRGKAIELGYALLTVAAAVFIGGQLGGQGLLPRLELVAFIALVALLGGMSRPTAVESSRFIIFTVLSTGMGTGGITNAAGMTIVLVAGALWTAVLSLAALWLRSLILRPCKPAAEELGQADGKSGRKVTTSQLLKHWFKSLGHFAGWQYTARITLCMFTAEIIGFWLNQERSYWIALTVALVVHRNFAAAFTRTFDRAVGTVVGVLLGGILVVWPLPSWGLIFVIGVFAALRPILRAHSYLAYSTMMTPLLVLLLSFGQVVSATLLLHRLVDTVVGAIISLVLGYFIWPSRQNTLRRN